MPIEGFPGRSALLADASITGAAWCRALSDATDAWLADLLHDATGGDAHDLALVAVGGYGRGELAPSSDLDLLLLHDGRRDVAEVAARLWYPIWDAKLKLGHAVRTNKEALRLADDDLDTATSFLTVRHLAGERRLTTTLADRALEQWQRRSRRRLAELAAVVDRRHAENQEVAFLLEPDLKDGRGGLRDVHALRWAQAAHFVLVPSDEAAMQQAYDVLLAARVELHRETGRTSNVLALQEQDQVAATLGYASADELMAAVAAAGRTIAWTSDESWWRVRSTLDGPPRGALRRDHPMASGLLLRDGEIHLDDSAHPATDPAIALRAATAAARHRTRIDRSSLDRLARETPTFPDPWPTGAVDDLVSLLLCGSSAIGLIESLDQLGLLVRVLPEWEPVRSKPQRNAYHRFTVDRHLIETAANAAVLTSRVSRPDLLVLGAMLHDIGKGYPGDHTERGIELVNVIGPRLGLGADDVAILAQLVRHHLLLPDVATRRDLGDDATITAVAEAVGSTVVLELLHALTEADSLATSAAAWGSWKAELVADLVSRTAHVLGGGEVHDVAWSLFPSPEVLAAMGAGKTSVKTAADRITVVAADRPGLFSRVAGVLSLHGLGVLSAQAHSDEQGMAASEFVIEEPEFGARWDRVTADLERALAGQLAIDARLAERARSYARRTPHPVELSPSLTVDNAASSNATVIEVRAPDAVGVLYRITSALALMLLDIRHAKVQTMGHEVVDTFYVQDAAGRKVTDAFHLAEIERAVLHALT